MVNIDASSILGLNARAQLFSYKYNTSSGKRIAASKLLTKNALIKAGVPTPKVYKKFRRVKQIIEFDWNSLPGSFVLKPSKGLGGDGIIVIKKRSRDGEGWVTTSRRRITKEDLELHTLDILEGAFSTHNSPDVAFIEEYVGRHKAFRKYAYRGTPDIRVIVMNRVPVMAMLRLPTKESGGRANLHQGAVGVGIDIATGITTQAIHNGRHIKFKPDTKRKLHGIKIPNWTKVLTIASDCTDSIGLGYMGVDVLLDPGGGPVVLEVNSQPGFQIQMANKAGLRKRLEKVEDLVIKDSLHGVKIAKVLFAEKFADRVASHEGVRTLKNTEKVKIYAPGKKRRTVNARVDTGALRTSIDEALAKELGLLTENNILWRKKYAYKSASGRQVRPVIGLTFRLAGLKIVTSASVANRGRLSTPLLIGRNDLEGFLVNPSLEHEEKK
jgi:alpha-L-glutamate ligase-like protein